MKAQRAEGRGHLAAVVIAALAMSYVVSGFSRTVVAQPPQNPPQPTFRTEANYVRVGEPVPTAGYRLDERDALITIVRQRINDLLAMGPV